MEEKQSEDPIANEKIENDTSTDVPAEEIENNSDVETVTETNTDSSDSDSDSDSESDSDSDAEFECTVCNRKFSGYLPFRQHQKGKKHAKAVLKKKKEKKLMKSDKTTESDEELLVQEPYASCKVCNKDFYGPESYEQHLKCKKHKQRMLAASILDQVQEEGKINADKLRDICKNKRKTGDKHEDSETMKSSALVDETKDEFQCKECEKEFSGFVPFTQHIMSKSHAKKVEQKNLLHEVIPESFEEDKTAANSEQDEVNTLCVDDDVLVCKICSTSFTGPENAFVHLKSKKHANNLDKHLRKLERRKKKSKYAADTNVEDDKKTDQTLKEQVLLTSSGSGEAEFLDSGTSSSSKNKEGLIAYEKYKEYKKIINALPQNQLK